MGDDGKLYKAIPSEMIALYRDEVIPEAWIVKMNQTEMEFLTGMKFNGDVDAFNAMDKVHTWGPSYVVLSSVTYREDQIVILGSSYSNGEHKRYKMTVPRLNGFFTGTGDLFSSLLLSYCTKLNFQDALQYTVSSIQGVLKNSPLIQETFNEINLIGSKDALLLPEFLYPIEEVNE